MIKLHEIKKGSKIRLETEDKGMETFIFDHIDGMYSYCYSESDKKRIIHLSVSTPLIKKGNYYLIPKG